MKEFRLSEMSIALIKNEMKFLFDRKNLEMILMGSKFVFDTKSYIELHHKIFAQWIPISPLKCYSCAKKRVL